MENLNWTGERLTTGLEQVHGVVEHLHRYAIAQNSAKDKVVLDIASGEGYGSFLLSKTAQQVYGVDIDQSSVNHANKKYVKNNLQYLQGSTDNIPLQDNSVDIVFSFETLEHHDRHDKMMQEISRVLKQDGCLYISSPEKSIYKQRDPNNPFHILELTFKEFEELINKYFKYSHFFQQRFVIGSLIHSVNTEANSTFKMFDGNYSQISEGLNEDDFYNKPFFNLAICSNTDLKDHTIIKSSIFNGVDVIKNELNELRISNQKVLNSKSYKLGNWFVRKLLFLKK